MRHDPSNRITLHRSPGRVRVFAHNTLIADSREALELREPGYPARQYLPRKDVRMEYLRRSQTSTHCPFKGDATYYSIELDGDTISDAAWSYEQPFAAVAGIKDCLAFDARLVEEKIDSGSGPE